MRLICRIYAAEFKAFKNGGSDVEQKMWLKSRMDAGCAGLACHFVPAFIPTFEAPSSVMPRPQ